MTEMTNEARQKCLDAHIALRPLKLQWSTTSDDEKLRIIGDAYVALALVPLPDEPTEHG